MKPRKPRRLLAIATTDGGERVAVWRQNGGLAITSAPRGETGYALTHVRTGHRLGALVGMSWRMAVTAMSLLSSLGPWGDVTEVIPVTAREYEELESAVYVVAQMVNS
jgi:hypothetical protein